MTFQLAPIDRYQQLPEPITGDVDCTAWAFALAAYIDSDGTWSLTGRQVRLASNEPKPDPDSPGLNLPQADAAVFALTRGAVNLDVRVGRLAVTPTEADRRLRAGQWAVIQVQRGILRAAGIGLRNRFAGGHAAVLGFHQTKKRFVLGDPLIDLWEDVNVAAVWRACAAIAGAGRANMAFTRDVFTAEPRPLRYSAVFERGSFWVYEVRNGVAVDRDPDAFTKSTSAPIDAPEPIPFKGAKRKLARVRAGRLKGFYVQPGEAHVALEAA